MLYLPHPLERFLLDRLCINSLLYVDHFAFCRSCALRDTVGSMIASDLTWMSLTPSNPLSVGQIVNNETRGTMHSHATWKDHSARHFHAT